MTSIAELKAALSEKLSAGMSLHDPVVVALSQELDALVNREMERMEPELWERTGE